MSPRTRGAGVVGLLLAWSFWAFFRGGDEFWRYMARSVRWRLVRAFFVAVAKVHFMTAAWVARLVDACPACFFAMPCPYHWTPVVGRNYSRVEPSRRQKRAAAGRAGSGPTPTGARP